MQMSLTTYRIFHKELVSDDHKQRKYSSLIMKVNVSFHISVIGEVAHLCCIQLQETLSKIL